MNLKDRINKLKDEKKKDNIEYMYFVLAKEFGWDYHQVNKLPIPYVLSMVNCLIEEYKEEQAKMKKQGKKPLGRR